MDISNAMAIINIIMGAINMNIQTSILITSHYHNTKLVSQGQDLVTISSNESR